MDADTRHQLKTNELAEALSKLRDFGRDPQTQLWVLVIVVILVAWGGYKYWNYARDSKVAQAWQELEQINRRLIAEGDSTTAVADLQALIDDSSNATVRTTARIRMAATLRQQAEDSPDEYEQLLSKSVAALEPVLEDKDAPPALVAAATFALATDHESLRQFDEAQTLYEQLRDNERFVGSPFHNAADVRLETLDDLRQPVTFLPGSPPPPVPVQATSQPLAPQAPMSVMPADSVMPTQAQPSEALEEPEGNATGETEAPADPAAVPLPPTTQPVP